MNGPEKPIEELIKQMSLKMPSESLDQRIERLSQCVTVTPAERGTGRWNEKWRSSAVASALSLLIGLSMGWVLSSVWRQTTSAVSMEEVSSQSLEHSEHVATGVGEQFDPSRRLSNEAPRRPKTRILEDRLVRTPAGEIRRVYRTATPQDFWYFDEESQQFQNVTISVPQWIVTTPRGI